ncbi:MAG: hypothetical protein QOJ12_1979, partial [Thermoleophilales bacterium]|nr:hypothetical protein [Thermoleophilales bacterium]
VLKAKATSAPRAFVPSQAQAALRGKLSGRALAGASDPRLNEALALLCGLQVQGTAAR